MPIKIINFDTGTGGGSGILVGNIVQGEIPTPSPDGIQAVFTTATNYAGGTLQLFRDQSILHKGAGKDYTETSINTFTVSGGSIPDSDEVIWVNYVKT